MAMNIKRVDLDKIDHCIADPTGPILQISDEHLALATAISLKRIADALTGTAVEELVRDLHGPLTNLAWELGRSFQAGTRTDR